MKIIYLIILYVLYKLPKRKLPTGTKNFIYFKIKIFIDAIRSSVFPITPTAMLSTISTVKVECGIFHKK